MIVQALSESAVSVQLSCNIDLNTHHQVMAFVRELTHRPFPGLCSVSPAFTTVLIIFDPFLVDKIEGKSAAESICSLLTDNYGHILSPSDVEDTPVATYIIPVRYGGVFGPDMEEVANRTGLGIQGVTDLHSSTDYHVFMIGFLPGFPYLGILPKALQLPRLSTPRLSVPAGSVAIAGQQTGIYPQVSPGGWHLIGQTELTLFEPTRNPPSLLKPGDKVRFVPY